MCPDPEWCSFLNTLCNIFTIVALAALGFILLVVGIAQLLEEIAEYRFWGHAAKRDVPGWPSEGDIAEAKKRSIDMASRKS